MSGISSKIEAINRKGERHLLRLKVAGDARTVFVMNMTLLDIMLCHISRHVNYCLQYTRNVAKVTTYVTYCPRVAASLHNVVKEVAAW
jgi:hypothetical protein